jgi:expansin (peptidoglycan-binding protein)
VNCSFDAVADIKGTFYGALETKTLHGSGTKPNFSNPAKYCGMCVEMKGPKATEIVHITDECPDCHEHNTGNTDIDLSTPAFNAIVGDIGIGRTDITWKEVPCPWTSPLQVIIQGSNEWSAKVIIANHVNRIASVEVMFGGSWQQMTRLVDNGWNKNSMNGTSKDFRITDIYGSEIIVTRLDFSVNPTNSKNFASTNFPACGLTKSTGEINNLDYISTLIQLIIRLH